MAKVIEKRFTNWQGQEFDEDTLEPSEVAEALMEYLDFECTYFPSMKDDDPIMSAYSYAKRESVKEGFVPVLIRADDETLLECLVMNADPENDADCYEFDLKTVAEYWFEQHGAIPAAMSHDELEFLLQAPVSQEQAMEVATEQYGFCPTSWIRNRMTPLWAIWQMSCGSSPPSGTSGGIDGIPAPSETEE